MKNNIKKLALIIFFFNNSFKIFSSPERPVINPKQKRQKQRAAAQAEKQQKILLGIFSGLISLFLLLQNNIQNSDKNNNIKEKFAKKNPVNLEQNVPSNFNIKVFSEKEIRELYKPANKCKFIKEITDFGFNDFVNINNVNYVYRDDKGNCINLNKFIVDNKNLLINQYKNNNYMLNYINYYVSTYDVNNNFDIAFSNQLNVIKLLIDDIKKDENDSNNFVTDFSKVILSNAFENQLDLFQLTNKEYDFTNLHIIKFGEDYEKDLNEYVKSLKISEEKIKSFIIDKSYHPPYPLFAKKIIKELQNTDDSIFINFEKSKIYKQIQKSLERFNKDNMNIYIADQINLLDTFSNLLQNNQCKKNHYDEVLNLFTNTNQLENLVIILQKNQTFFQSRIKNNASLLLYNNFYFQKMLINLIKKLNEKQDTQSLILLKPLVENMIINIKNSSNDFKYTLINLSIEDIKLMNISPEILEYFTLLHRNYFLFEKYDKRNTELCQQLEKYQQTFLSSKYKEYVILNRDNIYSNVNFNSNRFGDLGNRYTIDQKKDKKEQEYIEQTDLKEKKEEEKHFNKIKEILIKYALNNLQQQKK